VASIEASEICPPVGSGTVRPVLLAYAGSSSAVRAFTMNLRCGLTAATSSRRYELLRSYGYRYQVTSPSPGRVLTIAYLPDLFHLQPGVQDHDALRFVSAPPRWWLDEQEALLRPGRDTTLYPNCLHVRRAGFWDVPPSLPPLPLAPVRRALSALPPAPPRPNR
jgi:hypothetical protein